MKNPVDWIVPPEISLVFGLAGLYGAYVYREKWFVDDTFIYTLFGKPIDERSLWLYWLVLVGLSVAALVLAYLGFEKRSKEQKAAAGEKK
jgi:hypothetical protein